MKNQSQNHIKAISEQFGIIPRKIHPTQFYGIYKSTWKGVTKYFVRYYGPLAKEITEVDPFHKTAFMPFRNTLFMILEEIDYLTINYDESILAHRLWETGVINHENDVIIIAADDTDTLLILFENQIQNTSLIYDFYLKEFYNQCIKNFEKKSIQIFQC